jgi:hypothetical protein
LGKWVPYGFFVSGIGFRRLGKRWGGDKLRVLKMYIEGWVPPGVGGIKNHDTSIITLSNTSNILLSQLKHTPPLYINIITTTMSSPSMQYVYIPNLVGRQMLRIPVDDVETEDITNNSSQPTTSTPTSYTRGSSPSPSISSVSSVDRE